MGSRERVGVQRKFKGLMGLCLWRNIRNSWEISSTSFPSRLGMDHTFVFGIMCGAQKLL